jgi:IclR family acetate operon transcriptional repressor
MLDQKRPRGRPRAVKLSQKTTSVHALDRGLALLKVIAEADGLTLNDLAQRTGFAPSTAHRILTTLEAHRFVVNEENRGLWYIGVGAFCTGNAFLRNRRLAGIGRHVMRGLMEQTGETVNLGIEDQGEVVFISQVESDDTLRAFYRAGTRGALHASGVGKALMAEFPAERVRQILFRTGLKRFTGKTLVDPTQLLEQLAESRRRGWAIDDEERTEGIRCLAAPIFNEFSEAIAAVSISGPTVRMTLERLGEYGPLVRRTADAITSSIGGIQPRRT